MKKNMSFIDRLIRIAIATVIVMLYVRDVISGTWGAVMIAISMVFIATSLINFCPLYSALGVNRWERDSREARKEKMD